MGKKTQIGSTTGGAAKKSSQESTFPKKLLPVPDTAQLLQDRLKKEDGRSTGRGVLYLTIFHHDDQANRSFVKVTGCTSVKVKAQQRLMETHDYVKKTMENDDIVLEDYEEPSDTRDPMFQFESSDDGAIHTLTISNVEVHPEGEFEEFDYW